MDSRADMNNAAVTYKAVGEAAKVASYTKFPEKVCKFNAVTVMMTGDLKAQCEAKCDSSKQDGGCPGYAVIEALRYCHICSNELHHEGIDYKVNYGPETREEVCHAEGFTLGCHWDCLGHWCTTGWTSLSDLYWKNQ